MKTHKRSNESFIWSTRRKIFQNIWTMKVTFPKNIFVLFHCHRAGSVSMAHVSFDRLIMKFTYKMFVDKKIRPPDQVSTKQNKNVSNGVVQANYYIAIIGNYQIIVLIVGCVHRQSYHPFHHSICSHTYPTVTRSIALLSSLPFVALI